MAPAPAAASATHKNLWFNASLNRSQPLTTGRSSRASYTSLTAARAHRSRSGGSGLNPRPAPRGHPDWQTVVSVRKMPSSLAGWMSLGSSCPTCWMRFRFACRHWLIQNIRAGVLDNDSSLHHDRSPVACLDEHYDVAGHQFGPTVPGRPGRRFGFWRWRRNRPRRSGHPVYKPESILVHPIRLSRRGWPEYERRADGPGRANTRRLFGGLLPGTTTPPKVPLAPTDGSRRSKVPTTRWARLRPARSLSVSPGDSTDLTVSVRLTVTLDTVPPGLPGCTPIEVHPIVPGSSGRVD